MPWGDQSWCVLPWDEDYPYRAEEKIKEIMLLDRVKAAMDDIATHGYQVTYDKSSNYGYVGTEVRFKVVVEVKSCTAREVVACGGAD